MKVNNKCCRIFFLKVSQSDKGYFLNLRFSRGDSSPLSSVKFNCSFRYWDSVAILAFLSFQVSWISLLPHFVRIFINPEIGFRFCCQFATFLATSSWRSPIKNHALCTLLLSSGSIYSLYKSCNRCSNEPFNSF